MKTDLDMNSAKDTARDADTDMVTYTGYHCQKLGQALDTDTGMNTDADTEGLVL